MKKPLNVFVVASFSEKNELEFKNFFNTVAEIGGFNIVGYKDSYEGLMVENGWDDKKHCFTKPMPDNFDVVLCASSRTNFGKYHAQFFSRIMEGAGRGVVLFSSNHQGRGVADYLLGINTVFVDKGKATYEDLAKGIQKSFHLATDNKVEDFPAHSAAQASRKNIYIVQNSEFDNAAVQYFFPKDKYNIGLFPDNTAMLNYLGCYYDRQTPSQNIPDAVIINHDDNAILSKESGWKPDILDITKLMNASNIPVVIATNNAHLLSMAFKKDEYHAQVIPIKSNVELEKSEVDEVMAKVIKNSHTHKTDKQKLAVLVHNDSEKNNYLKASLEELGYKVWTSPEYDHIFAPGGFIATGGKAPSENVPEKMPDLVVTNWADNPHSKYTGESIVRSLNGTNIPIVVVTARRKVSENGKTTKPPLPGATDLDIAEYKAYGKFNVKEIGGKCVGVVSAFGFDFTKDALQNKITEVTKIAEEEKQISAATKPNSKLKHYDKKPIRNVLGIKIMPEAVSNWLDEKGIPRIPAPRIGGNKSGLTL